MIEKIEFGLDLDNYPSTIKLNKKYGGFLEDDTGEVKGYTLIASPDFDKNDLRDLLDVTADAIIVDYNSNIKYKYAIFFIDIDSMDVHIFIPKLKHKAARGLF